MILGVGGVALQRLDKPRRGLQIRRAHDFKICPCFAEACENCLGQKEGFNCWWCDLARQRLKDSKERVLLFKPMGYVGLIVRFVGWPDDRLGF